MLTARSRRWFEVPCRERVRGRPPPVLERSSDCFPNQHWTLTRAPLGSSTRRPHVGVGSRGRARRPAHHRGRGARSWRRSLAARGARDAGPSDRRAGPSSRRRRADSGLRGRSVGAARRRARRLPARALSRAGLGVPRQPRLVGARGRLARPRAPPAAARDGPRARRERSRPPGGSDPARARARAGVRRWTRGRAARCVLDRADRDRGRCAFGGLRAAAVPARSQVPGHP
jgi:hypothetical protein